jgi:hypothetical protein
MSFRVLSPYSAPEVRWISVSAQSVGELGDQILMHYAKRCANLLVMMAVTHA